MAGETEATSCDPTGKSDIQRKYGSMTISDNPQVVASAATPAKTTQNMARTGHTPAPPMPVPLPSQGHEQLHLSGGEPMVKPKQLIRFIDAVGRKFSFPFHACQTWAVRTLASYSGRF